MCRFWAVVNPNDLRSHVYGPGAMITPGEIWNGVRGRSAVGSRLNCTRSPLRKRMLASESVESTVSHSPAMLVEMYVFSPNEISWMGPRARRVRFETAGFHRCTPRRGTKPRDGSKSRPIRLYQSLTSHLSLG